MRVIPTLNFRFFSLCVLRALCVYVVNVRSPRFGYQINKIHLNRDCTPLTSGPRQLAGKSALEAGRRRMDFGRYGLQDCHLLKMVVHGPDRKNGLARETKRANI